MSGVVSELYLPTFRQIPHSFRKRWQHFLTLYFYLDTHQTNDLDPFTLNLKCGLTGMKVSNQREKEDPA